MYPFKNNVLYAYFDLGETTYLQETFTYFKAVPLKTI